MLYSVISKQVPPTSIDNTTLLGERPVQGNIANCVVISVCNIIEAKYWQQTGTKIKFNYDALYAKLNALNSGTQFSDINKLLDVISTDNIKCMQTLYCSSAHCQNEGTFKQYLQAAIHKFQFATIGCTTIPTVCAVNHALTVCGYDEDSFIVQTTYAANDRFEAINASTLYSAFVNFQCFDINNVVAN